MNNWIYVKDQMPEDYQYVLIACIFLNGNGSTGIGYYDQDNDEWNLEQLDDHPEQDDVMYWMTMPDPLPNMNRDKAQRVRTEHQKWCNQLAGRKK